MRLICAPLALGVGLLALLPEPALARQRRGGPAPYVYTPVQYGYCQPMYYPTPGYGYHVPYSYPAPPGYAVQYPPPAPTTTVTVALADDRFEPPTITVAPGTTVRWANSGMQAYCSYTHRRCRRR